MKKNVLTSVLTLGMLCAAQSAFAADLPAVQPVADLTEAKVVTVSTGDESFDMTSLTKGMKLYTAQEYAKEVEMIKADVAKSLAAGQLSQSEAEAIIAGAEETLEGIKNGDKVYHMETADGAFTVTMAKDVTDSSDAVMAMTIQTAGENSEADFVPDAVDLEQFSLYTADEYAKEVEQLKADTAKKVADGGMTKEEAQQAVADAEAILQDIQNGAKVYHYEDENGSMIVCAAEAVLAE